MYSIANWHLHVPKSREANVAFRLYILRRCREDVRFRKAVWMMCQEDILFFVNVFVWQFNPNAIGSGSEMTGPFVTWDFQDVAVEKILEAIRDRKDLVIEKSREMGASWLCLIIMLWFFLFHPMTKFLCISRNADAVDDSDDSDSLFWKLDYILRHLPDWMASDGSHNTKRTYNRRVQSFNNVENGSQITGQASTGKAGVGGRATAMFIDEFSQIKEDWEVLERTSDTTGCRIFNGTHKGTNTAFFEVTQRAKKEPHLCRHLVMHWSQHPDKRRGMYSWDRDKQQVIYHDPSYKYHRTFKPVCDGTPTGGPYPGLRSPWYDDACGRKGTARGVASDLDINPSGSIEQVFDPLLIATLKHRYTSEPVRYELQYDLQTAVPERLHLHSTGNIKIWGLIDSYTGKPNFDRYACGCDIAEGTGATPSCASLASAVTGQKVLECDTAHMEPKDFAYLIVAICRLFTDKDAKPARLIWETPGPGLTFGKHVIALGLRDVYYRTTEHRLKREISDTPGWTNSPDTMKFLIANYKDALREYRFWNPSALALDECLSFVYGPDGYPYHTGFKNPKDASAARVNHGDHVVADALCWKLIDEMGRLAQILTPEQAAIPATQQIGSLAWRAELAKLAAKSGWAD